MEHLDYYRANEDDRGSIRPFTAEGLELLISGSSHPRVLLARAAHVVRHAVEKRATAIDTETVREVTESGQTPPERDFTEGLDDAL